VGEPGYDVLRPKIRANAGGATELKLTVSPRRVVAGRRTRMRFSVTTTDGRPVAGRIRIGRTHIKTDANGRATARVLVKHSGAKRATVRSDGFRPGHADFRAVRRR
jgi:hypothetical protein